jgi:hypothetical protein
MSLLSLIGVFEGRPVVRVVFSDEAGVGSKKDEPITVIAGLLLNLDTQCEPLVSDIEDILTDVFKDAGRATEYEIKGGRLSDDLKSGREKGKYAKELVSPTRVATEKPSVPNFLRSD